MIWYGLALIAAGLAALAWLDGTTRLRTALADDATPAGHSAGCRCWCCHVADVDAVAGPAEVDQPQDPWADPAALISAWLTTDARVLLAQMPDDPAHHP